MPFAPAKEQADNKATRQPWRLKLTGRHLWNPRQPSHRIQIPLASSKVKWMEVCADFIRSAKEKNLKRTGACLPRQHHRKENTCGEGSTKWVYR